MVTLTFLKKELEGVVRLGMNGNKSGDVAPRGWHFTFSETQLRERKWA